MNGIDTKTLALAIAIAKTITGGSSGGTGDFLPISGGVLSGDLTIGSVSSTQDDQLRVAKQGSDGNGYQMGIYISGGNMVRIDYISNGSIANFMQLGPAETGFGKPVRVSSGGTGVTSYAELKTKLGIAPAAAVADAGGETVTAAEFNALLAALRAGGYLES